MDIRRIRETLHHGQTIYTLPMRVTFYARVSTDKYEQSSSLENQVDYFTDLITRNDCWTYIDGYIDEGISGTSTLKRNRFNRMIEDAKADRFDFIITKEISRFSRNTLDSIRYTQELLSMGVGVLFQNDNINTLDPDSEFRLIVMAGVAQDEVRKLSERLKFGFQQSIKNGRVLGNDRIYGYNKKDCKLTIHEEEAEIVRAIFDLYVNQRMGLRRLSQHLYDTKGITSRTGNPFNTTTIKNMILNPKYKGYYCGNRTKSIDYKTKKSIPLDESEWIVYRDENIPAIVSEEIWDSANALIKRRGAALRQSGAEYHNIYTYSGKLVCAEHGTSFHRQALKSQKGEKEIWQCKTYRTRGLAGCSAPQPRSEELDVVMAAIFDRIHQDKGGYIEQTLALIRSAPDKTNYCAEMKKLESEIEALLKKKDKLLELSMEELISNHEFQVRNEAFNKQIVLLEDNMQCLEKEQKKSQSLMEHLLKVKQALEQEFDFQTGINSELVTQILDKIEVFNTGNRNNVRLNVHLKPGGIILAIYDKKKHHLPGLEDVSLRNTCLKNITPNPLTKPT